MKYPDDSLALSLDDAIDIVQDAIALWGDGGTLSEPARVRLVLDDRLSVIVKEMRQKASPMVHYAGTVERPPLYIDLE